MMAKERAQQGGEQEGGAQAHPIVEMMQVMAPAPAPAAVAAPVHVAPPKPAPIVYTPMQKYMLYMQM